MSKPAALEKLTGIASRFGAFVAERHPFALTEALAAFDAATSGREATGEAALDALRPLLRTELDKRLQQRQIPPGLPDTTPRTPAAMRIAQAHAQLVEDCDGFVRRAALEASLTRGERIEILRGMLLT